ncbi:hypothetical protein SAMN02799624_06222 [Paenibacillus sp. UNC496MF]|nr:hypothetical protein SAMN02799624_06222 [Paenibacillus sp. UNC496MF]
MLGATTRYRLVSDYDRIAIEDDMPLVGYRRKSDAHSSAVWPGLERTGAGTADKTGHG